MVAEGGVGEMAPFTQIAMTVKKNFNLKTHSFTKLKVGYSLK